MPEEWLHHSGLQPHDLQWKWLNLFVATHSNSANRNDIIDKNIVKILNLEFIWIYMAVGQNPVPPVNVAQMSVPYLWNEGHVPYLWNEDLSEHVLYNIYNNCSPDSWKLGSYFSMAGFLISEIAGWSWVCSCRLLSRACLPSWFPFWAALGCRCPLSPKVVSLHDFPLCFLPKLRQ